MKGLRGKVIPWLLFGLGLAATVLAGRWAQGLFLESEFVHFSVNFPVEAGAEQLDVKELGGPWARLKEGEWRGYPAGGLLVWGREGEIVVDVGRQGVMKRVLQPRDVTLSTHWLRNVGRKARRIKLDMQMCGLPVAWETFERFWEEATKSATREIEPGKYFNMDWHVTLPRDYEKRAVICEGGLLVSDAGSGERLTFLPIRILNSGKEELSSLRSQLKIFFARRHILNKKICVRNSASSAKYQCKFSYSRP